jgi:hypothetical protein
VRRRFIVLRSFLQSRPIRSTPLTKKVGTATRLAYVVAHRVLN